MADKEIVVVRQAELEDVPHIVGLLEVLFTIEADFCIDNEKQTRGVQLLLADKAACALVAVLQDKVRLSYMQLGSLPKLLVSSCSKLCQQVVGLITIQSLISTAEGGYVGLIEDVIVDGQYRKKGSYLHSSSFVSQPAFLRSLST